MQALARLIALPFRLMGELVRFIRWLLFMVLMLLGNRLAMAFGGFGVWLLFTGFRPMRPDETPIAIGAVVAWLAFCASAKTIARLIVRPGMRLEPITMPAPPKRPARASAPPSAKATPAPVIIPPVPGGPTPPKPTRVALLVPPAPAAASPDEERMVAALSPALRDLIQRRG